MIKYNLNTINDWNFGDDNIIKVYRNNAVCYYKVNYSGDTPTFDVCYAVVEDITQYQETEFEDVYDKATEKWYKLNNLNQYEQYGVYGSGRTITTYDGKLTIDDGYEYMYSGGSWVNVGEVSGSTIDTVWYDPAATNGEYNFGHYFGTNYKVIFTVYLNGSYGSNSSSFWTQTGHTPIEFMFYQDGFFYDMHDPTSTTSPDVYTGDYSYRIMKNNTLTSYENSQILNIILTYGTVRVELEDGTAIVTGSTSTGTKNWYNGLYQGSIRNNNSNNKCHLSRIQVYNANNELVNDLKFIKNASVTSSQEISLYDSILDVTYNNANSNTPSYHVVSDSGGTEYPIYYDEKADPLNNLTFNTMEDAQAYAYNNCVYDGMKATIGTDRYYFDSEDENGWVKILSYYKVEDVTPNAASGWTITGSSTYNPDSSYYDDFSVENSTTSYQTKIAKVTIYGYDSFTYYLRSTGRTSYAYVVSTNVDELQSNPTSYIPYNSSSAITNTYYWNKTAGSAVNLSNYRRVTYNNLDKTIEHTFYVCFYGRTYSSYYANATILIPKEQTNENWEQVTFSSSTNVANTTKSLYIDNNYSTSGGTQYWYYRWMIGLPSGSHTSSSNHSSYDYCPNVTSSAFTSVAGEQRQVNFTYDNTTNKTLSFRLTDGSNVLTPSDTVYYNMTYYNSCGVSSSSSNVTFPRSQSVKVGGRFRFANSSNRHYIYGYSPNISLNYDYYVDNYQSTFDITYTKLSEEVVTITYTTYDPSDVETPSFKTDITWPYSGGTTSSTTLTSYEVPYTYSYEVSQTSDKFSTDKQSYTANQAARTISFILYPNNREFATVADMEAYQYAWEGMKAKVGDTKYEYKNGEWVENQYSLPDVPFTVNYNAKQYNASTKTLLKTEGQLADVDAVITAGTPTVHDGYLTIASGTRATISGYQTYFNRDNSNPNLTIISKQTTNGNNGHMFANRDSSYNWMYRCYSNKLTLHGSSETGQLAVTTQPVIESVRIYSNRQYQYNNYTNDTTSSGNSFNYGNTNSGKFALFQGYATATEEYFVGDFYWVYMCQGTLTDEQVQQVIDYNENL